MPNVFIANAFSAQMLDLTKKHSVSFQPVSADVFESVKTVATSVVGHPDTAKVLGVPCNRVSVKLNTGDIVFVAQLVGGRLPEGATSLPEGFSFVFVKVTILD